MKKRLTAWFLCLLMVFLLTPAALADGEAEQTPAAADEPIAVEESAAVEEAPAVIEEPAAVEEAPAETVDAVVTEPEEEIMASGSILINESNFPDANFRKWIVANVPGVTVDASGVCSISKDDAKKVEYIDVSDENIASLSGVGKFPNVITLICDRNLLTKLDVSALKELVNLSCVQNKLTALTLGSTKKLVTLYCGGNSLKSLSLSKNTAITSLYAQNNALTSIDVSPCTALLNLDVSSNKLKKLDVSKNTKLEQLQCYKNEITALDASKNTALWNLEVGYNALTALDVTKNTKLQNLSCQSNGLKTLDVTKNTALVYLDVNSNELSALDVTKNTKLTELELENNSVKTLDVTKCTALVRLNACGNLLTALDVTKNTKLDMLALYDNQIKSLDVTKNTALTELNVGTNRLTALNVSKNTKLTDLNCSDNAIKTLDLSANTKLTALRCAENQLTSLDLGALTALKNAECSPQSLLAPSGIVYSGGDYKFDLGTVLTDYSKVTVKTYPFNKLTGYITLPGYVNTIDYVYDTGMKNVGMEVSLSIPYNGAATVEFLSPVQFKGTTPYVIYNKKAQEPPFRVLDENGSEIDKALYTYSYASNTNPGTGYVNIKFKNTSNTAQGWFKIYLPGTTETTAENVKDGIKITWKAVEGAKGYVIYRRAWNSKSTGWTPFVRWNNTTSTTWTDTKVYAGTRYQYGIKAYFSTPTDNYNLGEVGPLKTNVRITTRVLKEVTGYTEKLVIKWEGSVNCSGYQLQLATDSAFTKGVRNITLTDVKTYLWRVEGLTSNRTYYVRIRSYTTFEGTKYYGEWSNVLSAKAK